MSWQRTISGSTFARERHESLYTKSGSQTTVGGTKMASREGPDYQFMSYRVFPAGHLPAPLPHPQNSRWQPDRWHGLSVGPRLHKATPRKLGAGSWLTGHTRHTWLW